MFVLAFCGRDLYATCQPLKLDSPGYLCLEAQLSEVCVSTYVIAWYVYIQTPVTELQLGWRILCPLCKAGLYFDEVVFSW